MHPSKHTLRKSSERNVNKREQIAMSNNGNNYSTCIVCLYVCVRACCILVIQYKCVQFISSFCVGRMLFWMNIRWLFVQWPEWLNLTLTTPSPSQSPPTPLPSTPSVDCVQMAFESQWASINNLFNTDRGIVFQFELHLNHSKEIVLFHQKTTAGTEHWWHPFGLYYCTNKICANTFKHVYNTLSTHAHAHAQHNHTCAFSMSFLTLIKVYITTKIHILHARTIPFFAHAHLLSMYVV